ncbi:MAG: type I-MYXAN CRISPR-associated protein Cas6/Cmx6 [Gammaproteobacteria bacterium]|nr:type I-MYXAN CRISPR-associated protein Cas6/Cmx6 [Gammaproteobacteria bacterium]
MNKFWQENTDTDEQLVADDFVDVLFRLQGKTIPVDHAWVLSEAISRHLPWFTEDKGSALHQIHVAESGNGWYRPDAGTDLLHLSRRTRLTLRLPQNKVDEASQALTGKTLDLAGCEITLGESSVKTLVSSEVLFARYVDYGPTLDEEEFLQAAHQELSSENIRVRKMLCGRMQRLASPEGEILTRSLMIADLDKRESIALQQQGLGNNRKLGCGVFIPHKGIDAVGEKQKKQ